MCRGYPPTQAAAMTETTFSSPRLERPHEAPFKGVCTALAQATGTDPVLWRVLIVVLTFFGGLGLALYLAGIVMIPAQDQEHSLGDRLIHGPDRHLTGGQIALVVVTVAVALGVVSHPRGIIVAAVAGVLGFLWVRNRSEAMGAAPMPTPVPAVPGAVTLTKPAPPRPPRPQRPRSPIVGLTLSLAGLVAGVLLLVGVSGGASVPTEIVLAAALGTVGLGLVVGSFWGRAPGLIGLAAVLGLALAATVAARPAIDFGVGDRSWQPTGSGSYRLGVGEATLDLTDTPLREGQTLHLDARVDVGHLLVLLPPQARVAVTARAELGDLLLDGQDTNGRRVARSIAYGPAGAPQLRLDLSVRTGQVEVRRG
jgi:phage shock protein PspC (stress-responsive transcriptional regulator)